MDRIEVRYEAVADIQGSEFLVRYTVHVPASPSDEEYLVHVEENAWIELQNQYRSSFEYNLDHPLIRESMEVYKTTIVTSKKRIL